MDDFTKVLLHFDESAIKDECGNTWSAYNNPPISETNAKFGKALQLDGSGYLSMEGGITLGGQDFTIDGWCYLNNTSPAYSRIFDIFNDKNVNRDRIALTKHNTANGMSLAINGDYPGTSDSFTNQLIHFAVVYQHSSSKASLYINGIFQLQLNATLPAQHYSYLYIGKSNWDADGLTIGTIDEFRISDGIARWSADFIPPSSPYGDEVHLYSKKLHMRDYINGVLVEEAVELFDSPYSDNFTKFFDSRANATVYADVVDLHSDFASRFRIKRNNQIKSLMKMKTIDSVPQLLISEVDYQPRYLNIAYNPSPTTDLIVSGTQIAIDAGDYQVEFKPAYGYKWFDDSLTSKFRYWKINKVSCNASISTDSVSLDNSNLSQSIFLSYEGSGEVSVTSNDTSIATVSITDGLPDGVFYDYTPDTSYKTITVLGKGVGSCKVSVFVASDNNHLPSDKFEINVDAEVYKALNACTSDEIQSIIRAGKAHKAWKVGDCTSDITLTSFKVGDTGTKYATTISGTYQAFILDFNHNNQLEDEGKPSVHFAFARKGDVQVAFCDTRYGKAYDTSNAANSSGVRFIHKYSNTNSNTNGWSGSYLKSTILPKFFNALPSDWQAIIQPCSKYTDNKGAASGLESDVSATSDYLWLLSEFEVYGTTTYSNPFEQNKQQQYAYFKNHSSVFYKHNSTSTIAQAWLRSVNVNNKTSYLRIKAAGESTGNAGDVGGGNANISRGIVPCFSVC